MYNRKIPIYKCNALGVWAPDFGDGPSFTKNDVKEIRKDEKRMCVVIVLKDGTKINPNFVPASDKTVLNERYDDWRMDILHLKSLRPPKANHKFKYKVYDALGRYVDETTAVSEAKAVNNVRYNWFGIDASNDDFFAVRVDQDEDEVLCHWYAVEFSIARNGEVGFNQQKALYEIKCADSETEAKRDIEYEYFKVTDDKCIFVNIYFDRIKGFTSETEALMCAKEWRIKNKEDI